MGVPEASKGGRVKRLPILVAATAILLAGCSSGYTYVTNSKTKTFFKIPD
jgi:hypothetical protein